MSERMPARADQGPALADLLDRMAITQVIHDWGLYRDTGRWDRLRLLYAASAEMQTTWFAGSAEDFIQRSAAAATAGQPARHFIGAVTTTLGVDRAIAESRMILMLRAAVAGIPVDVTCHGRFLDRFVREAGAWRIRRRIAIYDRDRLDPLEPGCTVPLDHAALARLPEGHRHLAWVQSLGGARLIAGLPSAGSPEEAAAHAAAADWLAGPRGDAAGRLTQNNNKKKATR